MRESLRHFAAAFLGLAVLAGSADRLAAQGLTYARGQSVSPAFEGWNQNPDGSYNFLFGYLNRNWEEELNIPVGAGNSFSPGPADRGQPTHFLPRRNRFTFIVTVPADWGDRELVWTLHSHGEENVAIASLRDDYFVDNVVIMSETGGLGPGSSSPAIRAQQAPSITLEIAREIVARVGEPVRLVAHVTDDGLPTPSRATRPVTTEGLLDYARASNPPTRRNVEKVNGLHMTWFVYRAPEGVDASRTVSFHPPQIHSWEDTRPFSNSPWASGWTLPALPTDGRWTAGVTFSEPGMYVLRGRADDGGLYADEEVTVRVESRLP